MNSYLKIIRLPNLLIIILTQYLIRICIIRTYYSLGGEFPALGEFDFVLLVLSTVLIAAGGYVINDYYDLQTDQINKPKKVIIRNSLPVSSALHFYWALTISGILIGFYLAFKVSYVQLGLIYIAIVLMLWFYSEKYKRTAIWGNLMISGLSAMVIIIVWLFEFFALRTKPQIYIETMKLLKPVTLIVAGYAVFAFLVTLIREVVKDAEDVDGDKASGFKTLPVVSGVKMTKWLAAVFILLTMIILATGQYFLYKFNLTLVFWYFLIAVQTLFVFLLYYLIKADTKEDYHFLSNTLKIIMVAGILSMQLFYISF